jgi:hypothetical protein
MTGEENELPLKQTHDALGEQNNALQRKCVLLSKKVSRLLEDSDDAVKAAQALIQRIP